MQQDWTFADSVEAGVVSDAAPRFIWMANKETDLRRGALTGARQPSAPSNPVTLRVWRSELATVIRWIDSLRGLGTWPRTLVSLQLLRDTSLIGVGSTTLNATSFSVSAGAHRHVQPGSSGYIRRHTNLWPYFSVQ